MEDSLILFRNIMKAIRDSFLKTLINNVVVLLENKTHVRILTSPSPGLMFGK